VTIDSSLVGAWTRDRLVVDGVRCIDRCRVLWLQTADYYADIRLPGPIQTICDGGPEIVFARPAAFAGTASWDRPIMTWHHQLDSWHDEISESSPLHFEGDLLVESGQLRWAGLRIPFREEWRRISSRQDETAAAVDVTRIEITVGRWRIEIEDDRPTGAFRASRHDFAEGSWRLAGTILEPANLSLEDQFAQ
jgi:hypothetical protein